MNLIDYKFKTIAESNLAKCFVPVDGQALSPDSTFFVKIGSDMPNDQHSFLGTNGVPCETAIRFRFFFGERLAIGDAGIVVSLRGNALKHDEPRILHPTDNGEGYNYIAGRRLGRLVWEVFMGAIPRDLEVDHMNRVRNDDRLCNLRLVTHSDNLRNCKVTNHNKWKDDDVALVIDSNKQTAMLVHPKDVTKDLTGGDNSWKMLHGDRLSDNGWYAIVNPTKASVMLYFDTAYSTPMLKVMSPSQFDNLFHKCLALVD